MPNIGVWALFFGVAVVLFMVAHNEASERYLKFDLFGFGLLVVGLLALGGVYYFRLAETPAGSGLLALSGFITAWGVLIVLPDPWSKTITDQENIHRGLWALGIVLPFVGVVALTVVVFPALKAAILATFVPGWIWWSVFLGALCIGLAIIWQKVEEFSTP